MVGAIGSTSSYILPANERMYKVSNLLGEWKGIWSGNQVFSFKVVNIKNNKAQIEYTHDGRKETGTAKVDQNTITFGNVTIATNNGSTGVMQFKAGNITKTTDLAKAVDTSTSA